MNGKCHGIARGESQFCAVSVTDRVPTGRHFFFQSIFQNHLLARSRDENTFFSDDLLSDYLTQIKRTKEKKQGH